MSEKRCTFKEPSGYHCGSYAFNLSREDIKQGKLCDKHYWQVKFEALKAERKPMTDDEVDAVCDGLEFLAPIYVVRAVEAFHNIKE